MMGTKLLVRLAAAAAGGALALAAGAPALADNHTTTATLRQSEVLASDPEFDGGFGECTEKPDQGENEDIWVFVWPGNQVTELVSLTLNFDSTGDGVADQVLTEEDATATTDQGTLKVWVATPAGWTLIDGTSEVVGTLPGPPGTDEGKFNLTHSCAGEPGDDGDNGDNGDDGDDGDNGDDGENGDDGDNGDEGEGDKPDEELPLTGSQTGRLLAIGGVLLTVGAGLAVGGTMFAARRRRQLTDLADVADS